MNEMNLLLAALAIETYKFILQVIAKIGLSEIGSIPTLGSYSSIKSICHSCRSIRTDFWLFGQVMVQMSDLRRGTEIQMKRKRDPLNWRNMNRFFKQSIETHQFLFWI